MMTRAKGLLLICVLLLLGGCAISSGDIPTPKATATVKPESSPEPTRTPQPTADAIVATWIVQPELTYQTMDGIGACSYAFPYASDVGWNWGAVKYVFDEVDLAYIRLAPWLGWWETANDNDDPYTINWDGFGTVNDIINNHDVPYATFLNARGIELGVGVWDFGGVSAWCETCEDWLASGNPRTVPAELYAEVGESIAAYILNMRNHGVDMAFAEVQNEPDIQASILYPSPEAFRDAGRVIVDMFDHFGLDDVMLHAPNLHSPGGNVPWIEAWFDDPVLYERTAAISYHTWWVPYRKPFDEIWAAAQKYDKPVWATETGYHEAGNAISPNTWRTAWQYAKAHYRAIAWSHASRTYIWTILGNDGAIGVDGEPYPTLQTLKHFANYIPAGAVLVESHLDVDNPKLMTLAFALPDGRMSLIFLNDMQTGVTLTLEAARHTDGTLITTTDADWLVPGDYHAGDILHLPPQSITSMMLDSAN